jgi:arylsulfatase A-like enzyme
MRFHTTAICSPTRAALITGRNHHSVGMGGITEMATSAPGYNSMRPNSCAPLPEILKLNGYATAHFGKCHEVPVWESSPVGPFDRWPTACPLRYVGVRLAEPEPIVGDEGGPSTGELMETDDCAVMRAERRMRRNQLRGPCSAILPTVLLGV